MFLFIYIIVRYGLICIVYASDYFQLNNNKQNTINLITKLAMENQSQLPIGLFNFKNSDKNSQILSFHPSLSHADIDCFDKRQKNDQNMDNECLVQESVTSEKAEEYFNLLFSPKLVAQCLVRRNQYLEMKCLQNQESQPEQIYHKRKERVCNLKQRQKKNWNILISIKKKQPEKYRALTNFMKFLGQVKIKLNGVRHDYFSQKTFLTLQKATTQQINQLSKILSQILQSVFRFPQKLAFGSKNSKGIDQRYEEFLIIPRFFISKQKLLRFIRDQILQQNFKFLIYNGCLGHYNNEANKKLPQQTQMKHVRMLLSNDDGKQRFKKICSINHGGKFIKKFGNLYYQLYDKSFQCLKNVEILTKKSSCTQVQIRQQLSNNYKILFQKNEKSLINDLQNDEIVDQSECRSIQYFLSPNIVAGMQKKLTKTQTQFKQNFLQLSGTGTGTNDSQIIKSKSPSKCKLRRPNSLVVDSQMQLKSNSTFRLKKSLTMDTNQAMQTSRQKNIIIIHPPVQILGEFFI